MIQRLETENYGNKNRNACMNNINMISFKGRKWKLLLGILLWVMLVSAVMAEPEYLSPLTIALDEGSGKLYISMETGKQVVVFSSQKEKIEKVISVPEEPSGIALAPDGNYLYITGGLSEGMVFVVGLKNFKVINAISVGHSPCGPVVSPDGKQLYICNRFRNKIVCIDLALGKKLYEVKVAREPVAAVLSRDGGTLFVANHLPAGSADGEYSAAVVSVIDTEQKKTVAAIRLPNGATSLEDICISPEGDYVYVTHILARYHLPTTQLERGWMNTNALSIIDGAGEKLINTVLLDDVDLGAGNPWGVVCSADGEYICVAQAGSHEISIINRKKLHDKLAQAEVGKKKDEYAPGSHDVSNTLSFLVDIRERVPLKGNSPRDLAIIGDKVYAAEYFSDSLGVVDISSEEDRQSRSISLGPNKNLSAARRGKMLFHDATICFQNWQSCASCHPDGRTDGLNWDLLNDGIGNPKNTKSLLFAHQTPPAMITGVRDCAETAVRAGMRYIQFMVRPEKDAAAIDEYLRAMKAVPSPYLVEGNLIASGQRGEKIFERGGCGACHSGHLFTDLKKYNVGTGKGPELNRKFDTPTLREVWRTAPYLYDGRAATIAEVVRKYNPDDKHGKTSNLTEQEIADLAEYVLSQ